MNRIENIRKDKPDLEKIKKKLRESYKRINEEKYNNSTILIIDPKIIKIKSYKK